MSKKLNNQNDPQAQLARIKAFMAMPENRAYYYNERKKIANEVFIKRLKEMRKAKGLTQKDVAKLLGVEQPEVSRIESGKESISFDRIIEFVTALNGRLEVIY